MTVLQNMQADTHHQSPGTQQTWKKWQALQALLEDYNAKFTRSADIFKATFTLRIQLKKIFLMSTNSLKQASFYEINVHTLQKVWAFFGN